MEEVYPVKDRLIKGLFVFLFLFAFGVCRFLLHIIALVQFLFDLISGKPNNRLFQFSSELKDYIAEVVVFVTYQSDTKPFPFSDWPKN